MMLIQLPLSASRLRWAKQMPLNYKTGIRSVCNGIRPANVRQVRLGEIDDAQAHSILQSSSPCIFKATDPSTASQTGHAFLSTLRALHRMVPVELGEYASPDLERVQLPLSAYLDWLDQGHSRVHGKQLYLAQESDLWQDEPALQSALPIPTALQWLISNKQADLYQAALFLGPPGASSALHFDPTSNLFQIVSAHANSKKVFLLCPPSLRDTLGISASSGRPSQNTLNLPIALSLSQLDELTYTIDQDAALSQAQQGVIAKEAQGAVLGEGDLLYLPPRWWHMVQNISQHPNGSEGVPGFVAGMGWWFHLRQG